MLASFLALNTQDDRMHSMTDSTYDFYKKTLISISNTKTITIMKFFFLTIVLHAVLTKTWD